MKYLTSTFVILAAMLTPFSFLHAHHNTHSEFGWFDKEPITFEGKIVNIAWSNPHVAIDFETTGGDVPAGEKWRLVSHPVNIMNSYNIKGTDFTVGDSVKVIGWPHRRGLPAIWLRAVKSGDGPMRSIMRFTDMRDIANGVLEEREIQPAYDLNGSMTGRAGDEVVEKLRAMSLVDDDGRMIWPPPESSP